MKIAFTSAATSDLEQIVDFLCELGGSAAIFIDEVEHAIAHLARWPDTGTRREHLGSDARLRFWLIDPYQIAYIREPDGLLIVAVIHTARDMSPILLSRLGGARP